METIHFIIIQNLNISALVRVPMSSVLHTLLMIPFQLFLGSTGLASLSATLAFAQDSVLIARTIHRHSSTVTTVSWEVGEGGVLLRQRASTFCVVIFFPFSIQWDKLYPL